VIATTAASRADVAIVVVTIPSANRVALTDAIVVGRVVAHEDKDVAALNIPGGLKGKYRIAIVKVAERVYGLKDAKFVRVGYVPRMAGGVVDGERFRDLGAPDLTIGLDGAFFLTKHFAEDFFVVPMPFDFMPRATVEFDRELPAIRGDAKMLENPLVHLKAKNPEERFEIASLLVTKYRGGPRPAGVKTEAVGQEESQRILKGILEAKWDRPRVLSRPHPWQTFLQLGLTEKDGWKLPMGDVTVPQYHRAAREWLQKNWETVRVQRFVRAG